MAQNITIMGASYSDVPAVTLPKTGGGTAKFTDVTDTTAAAADVAAGKYFYDAAGTRTQGTASGGGASNVIMGTFTTSSTAGSVQTITLPYSGTGYPVSILIYVAGGVYNNTSSGNTEWYNKIQRYAIGLWGCVKSRTTEAPGYTTSGAANYGTTFAIYKSSTSSATSYTRTSAMNTNTYSSSNAANSAALAVRMKGNSHTLTVYVASTSYGLMADTEYEYQIIYSS